MRQSYANRIDANQPDIVRELRRAGASVQSLGSVGDGAADLLVGHMRRNWLFEVKDPAQPPSKRRLTPEQIEWHRTWNGQVDVIQTADDALIIMGLI